MYDQNKKPDYKPGKLKRRLDAFAEDGHFDVYDFLLVQLPFLWIATLCFLVFAMYAKK